MNCVKVQDFIFSMWFEFRFSYFYYCIVQSSNSTPTSRSSMIHSCCVPEDEGTMFSETMCTSRRLHTALAHKITCKQYECAQIFNITINRDADINKNIFIKVFKVELQWPVSLKTAFICGMCSLCLPL